MPYRVVGFCVLAPLPKGGVQHKYEGELIEWLPDALRTQWLADGLITEIPTVVVSEDEAIDHNDEPKAQASQLLAPAAPAALDAPVESPCDERAAGADECVNPQDEINASACAHILDDLDLPLRTGAPTARKALRARGLRFSNETIAAAIRIRREALSGTGQSAGGG
ncbi:hypothetical protein AWC11_17040 [Mycobacterium interjectum]|nr:hypothetical protein AWC11_17040 [Mycobacterium interjectum]